MLSLPTSRWRYLQLERCHLARGLDVQNRFKRCLPVCPIAQIRLEISPLQLGGGVLPVQNPPIRPHLSPICVYQTPSPSCRAVQAGWSENPRLPGRLATIGIRPRFTERPRRVHLMEKFNMCRHSLCILLTLTAGRDRVILLESIMKPRNSID